MGGREEWEREYRKGRGEYIGKEEEKKIRKDGREWKIDPIEEVDG